jgi:hypothetical protein
MTLSRAALLVASTSTLSACSEAAKVRAREGRDRAELGEAVDSYWRGVRWLRIEDMAPYLASADDQLAIARFAASPPLRITDAAILQVVVDTELVDPRTRPSLQEVRREGAALVRVEWFSTAGTTLQNETVEQRWYLDGRGWHVDVGRSPLDPDRPW